MRRILEHCGPKFGPGAEFLSVLRRDLGGRLPVIAEDDFYVVYLSKGMTLEAQSIARYHITGELSVRPVIQVYRKGDIRGGLAGRYRDGGCVHR